MAPVKPHLTIADIRQNHMELHVGKAKRAAH
jgi:hypothetical protein